MAHDKVYGICENKCLVEVPYGYSTKEMIIGKWIDGKTLYRKGYDLGIKTSSEINNFSVTLPDNTRIVTDIKVIAYSESAIPQGGYAHINYTNSFRFVRTPSDVRIVNVGDSISNQLNVYVILEYTKH